MKADQAASSAYADTVARLMGGQEYEPSEVTLPVVVHDALNRWLRYQIEHALRLHAAGGGPGHLEEDRCESWYALHDALTGMHADSHRFVHDLLDPPARPKDHGAVDGSSTATEAGDPDDDAT